MSRAKLFKPLFVIINTLALIVFVCISPSQATGLPGARSVTNTAVFLGGNYIELGIQPSGKFGSSQSKPVNFFGSPGRSQIGMVSDFDGFDTGYDSTLDYFMPGSPEERWVVGYKIGVAKTTFSNAGTAIVDQSSGDVLKAQVTGGNSTVETKQIISFNVNDKFFKTTVTLKNISADTLDSLRYMRSFDPDNTVDRGGDYETHNEVLYTYAEDGKVAVSARTYNNSDPIYVATGSRAPILFYTDDARAKGSVFGFANTDPYAASAYDTPRAKNDALEDDVAITIAFDLGVVNAGDSVELSYYTSLDERDFDEVIQSIQLAEATPTPTPIATATPTIAPTATNTPTPTQVSTPTPTKKPIILVKSTSLPTPTEEEKIIFAVETVSTPILTPTAKPVIKQEVLKLQFLDVDKRPLIGASVKVKDDPTIYKTDSNGYIEIQKPKSESVEVSVTYEGKTETKVISVNSSAGSKNEFAMQTLQVTKRKGFDWRLICCLVCFPVLLLLLILVFVKKRKKDTGKIS
jgi:hypothetical protein